MKPFLKFDIKLQRNGFLLDAKAEIKEGMTGVFGPSGHGKTTLLNAVSGLVKPDSGFIEINGESVFDAESRINLPVRKRKVGYVFQDVRLFPHLSVKQNLKYGLKNKNAGSIDIEEVSYILQINHLQHKKPLECSGGEKQRIAIGRALLSGARVLIMDEPFSAVDVNLRNNIIPFLYRVNNRFKIPMLIVSHDLPDLLSLTSNLLLLEKGKVRALGKFQDLILNESNVELMKGAGLYNVFNLSVFATLPEKNMMLLNSDVHDFQVQALCQPSITDIKIGQQTKVLIRPEDVSIALRPVEQISLRNQIEGLIVKIFSKDGFWFCLVDAGEKILVEITEASGRNMHLEPGKKVWCLFKSAALKIF
ncbi:MAG: molybdenum ABC transporter ATP-binding protein [Prolixibacteraceae bacterium]